MTPYYDDGQTVIYHGDCREIDAWDIAGGIMVTDPPYGMNLETGRRVGWQSRWAGVTIAGDEDTALRDEILAAWGARPALVFATWKRPLPVGTREVLVWDKVVSTGMGDLEIPWRPSWEAVCLLGSGFVGRRTHGVLHYPLPTLAPERKHHPTVKPLSLMRHLIDRCPPLATIVDPFMGSGTTLRAAKDLGRSAVGIELEERYCEIAAKRLAQGAFDFGATA